jgi:hypothetical protein
MKMSDFRRCFIGYRLLVALVMIPAALFTSVHAMTPEEVPEPLKPWVDWVLDDVDDLDCPHFYNNGKDRRCAWPTALVLKIKEASATFEQTWRVFGKSRVTLPGSMDLWPQDVSVNGDPVTVLVKNGRPGVHLDPGTYRIRGTFSWQILPDAIVIPRETALVTVSINNRPVKFPDIDENGRVWLKKQDVAAGDGKDVADRFDIQVFRLIIDEIPMKVVTAIDLQVSGDQREVMLDGALPEGFIPLDLKSPLPARLESDGRLRLQIRPGNWHMEVISRSTLEQTSLSLNKNPEPWPDEEVWAFDGRNHLRLVEIKGVPAIDPRQTTLPGGWRNFPAYRVKNGDTMILVVVRRGDPDPVSDQLALTRNLWLDFNGSGYTIQDRITGTMTRGWRLETGPEVQLGRVLIDGMPQFITTLPGADRQGVEVRRGSLNLTADLRYEKQIGNLPATGWAHDFQQVSSVLHMPPGWKVLTLGGVDNVPATWFKQWTLMDLFLVLMIAVSFFKLWNWRWGLLSLAMAVLTWHEPNAPRYIWLNILAAIALLRVVPKGMFRDLVTAYRNAALVVLALLAVPFMVNQVKTGLFPQLERPWQAVVKGAAGTAVRPEIVADAVMEQPRAPLSKEKRSVKGRLAKTYGSLGLDSGTQQAARLDQIDPTAIVQTGPGIPDWQWRSIAFNWNGPVKQDQRIKLVLLSPGINLVLNFFRVLMLVMLAVFIIKKSFSSELKKGRGLFQKSAVLMVLGFICLAPQAVHAEFPGPDLLTDLKEKLTSPSDCLPECARISRMVMDVEGNSLTIRMEVHAGGSVVLPLVGSGDLWLSGKVAVDGTGAGALYRSGNDDIRVHLAPGIHQVLLAADLTGQDRVTLPFPVKPAQVTFTANGWDVKGVRDNGLADSQIQLERIGKRKEEQQPVFSEASVLPVFVKVERTLRLGLEWEVETMVSRLSPRPEAVILEIPLIPGESVTTGGITVKDGRVLVNMGARRQRVGWRSVLKKQPDLTITAADTTRWIEVWKADVSTVWHTSYSGLAAVHHQDQAGRRLPEWRPWPGERLTLDTIRPAGIKGQTLTVNNSKMTVTPGRRATDVRLDVSLTSSRGGRHTIILPRDSDLREVFINGRSQPIRQKDQTVTLPVTPGTQAVRLMFRSENPITKMFLTPVVDLNTPSVNHGLNVRLGHDRWVLWMTGPRLGPAVLFWGVLLVVLIVAVGLGRIRLMPLKTWQWFLLGMGLSQTSVFLGLVVVGWLFALGIRKNMDMDQTVKDYQFNLIQVGLAVLTLAALAVLFVAVQKGLLGLPEMQISGNQSGSYNLNWFQDRIFGPLPASRIISVPLLGYRIVMLLWALWLAFSLLSWLRWGWQCFAANGLWRKIVLSRKKRMDSVLDDDGEENEMGPQGEESEDAEL